MHNTVCSLGNTARGSAVTAQRSEPFMRSKRRVRAASGCSTSLERHGASDVRTPELSDAAVRLSICYQLYPSSVRYAAERYARDAQN